MLSTPARQAADNRDALSQLWSSVLLFIPKALAFVGILVAGYLIARAVHKIVEKGLHRVGFDRAVERGSVGKALGRSPYDASDVLAKLAYYAVLLLALQLAFGIWGPNPVSDLINAVITWLPRAFVAIVIVVVAAAIANAVRDLVQGSLGGLSYGRLLGTLAFGFILGLGVIAALNQVGIATTVTTPVLVAMLATVSGILIVGVGGGLVRPMQRRWEGWLDRAATESRAIREQTHGYAAGRDDLRQGMDDRTELLTPAAPQPPPAGPQPPAARPPAASPVAGGGPDTMTGDAAPAPTTRPVPTVYQSGGIGPASALPPEPHAAATPDSAAPDSAAPDSAAPDSAAPDSAATASDNATRVTERIDLSASRRR